MPPTRRSSQARRSSRRGVATPRQSPRPSQRERLIDAVVELSGQLGYQTLTIAQISARAGVSSATFYEQFEDREACLLAAYRELSGRTLRSMEGPLQAGEWASAARPAFSEVLQSVRSDPDAGRLMFVEAPSGGPRLRAETRLVLDGLEQTVEALLASPPRDGYTLDVPARALIGAVRHLLARQLRTHNEDRLEHLAEELLSWMGSYAVPASAGRWSPGALLAASGRPGRSEERQEPERLPRGRHGLAPAAVARSQRSRILAATATVTMQKGYAAATVADVVSAAGVAKEAFYRHFADKQEAFLEAQRYQGQSILDELVRAYFSADDWAERVWRALRTLLELIERNPAAAHLRLVECYSAGTSAVRRAEEMTRSFTIFLEEGFRQREQAGQLPRICPQAIAAGMFEMVQHAVATGAGGEVGRRLPQLTYVAIAPFVGPVAAIESVSALMARG